MKRPPDDKEEHWDENGFTILNSERLSFGKEVYVFASQAHHIFYVEHPQFESGILFDQFLQ